MNRFVPTQQCKVGDLKDYIQKANSDMTFPMQDPKDEQNEQFSYYLTNVQPRIEYIMADITLSKEEKVARIEEPMEDYNQSSLKDMAIEILDKIFFGGALAGRVRVAFKADLGRRNGTCWTTKDENGENMISIELNYNNRDSEVKIRQTLIHELLHGYANLGKCDCSAQCKEEVEDVLQLGCSGHGWFWQSLAAAVETLGKRHWGPTFGVNREKAALRELLEGEGELRLPEQMVDTGEGMVLLAESQMAIELLRCWFPDEQVSDRLCAKWKKKLDSKNAKPELDNAQ